MENENSNMENENQYENSGQERFETQPEAPVQYTPQMSNVEKPKKHMALAVTSLVLSGVSLLCCWAYGIGIVPALIGTILGLIALIKGKGSVKVMGGIGFGLGLLGTVLSIFMIVTYIAIINWENVSLDKFQELQYINPENEAEMRRWLQQFFNVDISSYYY
ncbi:MAG: hypothetical protein J1F02_02865 [Lachnospiraceae bacterium]|nr:hypothetical protein [Lachnospiraceae bacterium]